MRAKFQKCIIGTLFEATNMKKSTLLILMGSALALVACGEAPAEKSSSPVLSSESTSEASSVEPSSLPKESSSAPAESSASPVVSSSSASSSKQEPASSWTLSVDSSLLGSTSQSQYLNDFSFNASRSDGESVPFYGDNIQQGNGEWAGTIQMKKSGSYIYSKAALPSCHVSMGIKIRGYGGNDYSGTPTFFVGQTENPATEKTSTFTEKDGVRVFEFDMEGYFKLANNSANAMYVLSIDFAAN